MPNDKAEDKYVIYGNKPAPDGRGIYGMAGPPPNMKCNNHFIIHNPDTIKYVERTPFIKSIESVFKAADLPLEEIVLRYTSDPAVKRRVRFDHTHIKMAQDYKFYSELGARLPKFGRWAAGMFRDDRLLQQLLADAGKYIENNSDIVISGQLIDILRSAATPHFYSCFNPPHEAYGLMPKHIAEDTPGIAIAFVDDADGFMRGRCWVHHAVDDEGPLAVICQRQGGTVDAIQIARLLKDKGVRAAVPYNHGAMKEVRVNFEGCFTQPVHHDMSTWIIDFPVYLV